LPERIPDNPAHRYPFVPIMLLRDVPTGTADGGVGTGTKVA
jgi:hypothetical protein